MGGIIPAPSEGFVAWTGGKPKVDWTGLDDAYAQPISQNQYRSFFGAKSLAYRRKGLETKFKQGDDLVSFKSSIWQRFTDSGLDTITYLPDISTGVMTNVIENHTRFTTDYAKQQHLILRPLFDTYDMQNDNAATHWWYLTLSCL